ncbi:hypothetical protein [Klebsiella pneumoniae]|uniref:hypothetical protein n=1 Tax=Klebsiella pneumoniae TaxID=573 RepID=UPI0028FAB3DE|nr:hypothetical protein [Klebsiella pneumoniae]MDT9826925.1 hypothetical protein [Klebsiella pneumoniae]
MKSSLKLLLEKPLFFLFCLFIPFDNTPLSNFGGIMTASPSALILLPGLFISFMAKGNVVFNKKIMFIYLLTLLISFLYFFYWANYFKGLSLGFIFERGNKFFLLYMFYLLSIVYCMMQKYEDMVAGAKLIIFIVFLSVIVNFLFPSIINNPSIIQANAFPSTLRLRGFSVEASLFGFQIVCAAVLIGIIYNIKLPILVVATLMFAIITTSKGAALSFLICVCCYYATRGYLIFRIFLSILSALVSFVIFKLYILPSLTNDIESYNSVATRLTMFVSGLTVFLYNPFGVGYYGYIPSIYAFTPDVISRIGSIFPILNFSEVQTYTIIGEYKAVGTKSMIIDCIMFFGLLFIIPFIFYIKRLSGYFLSSNDRASFILLLFVVLSNLFFIAYIGSYMTPFMLSFLTLRYRQNLKNSIEYVL